VSSEVLVMFMVRPTSIGVSVRGSRHIRDDDGRLARILDGRPAPTRRIFGQSHIS
jgi:hypothetical protein